MEDNVFITITVTIAPKKYAYEGCSKQEIELVMPINILQCMNSGNIVEGLVQSAISEYVSIQEEIEKEKPSA